MAIGRADVRVALQFAWETAAGFCWPGWFMLCSDA